MALFVVEMKGCASPITARSQVGRHGDIGIIFGEWERIENSSHLAEVFYATQ